MPTNARELLIVTQADEALDKSVSTVNSAPTSCPPCIAVAILPATDRIARKVSIPLCRAGLRMAQHFPDYREGDAACRRDAREAVPKIIKPTVFKSGSRPDTTPWLLYEYRADRRAGDRASLRRTVVVPVLVTVAGWGVDGALGLGVTFSMDRSDGRSAGESAGASAAYLAAMSSVSACGWSIHPCAASRS